MQYFQKLTLLCLVIFSFGYNFSSYANEPKEIFWEDLIPKGHVQIDTQDQASHEGTEQNWVQPDLDAVVTGVISTETWSGDIAQVGYKMTAVGVAPFEL